MAFLEKFAKLCLEFLVCCFRKFDLMKLLILHPFPRSIKEQHYPVQARKCRHEEGGDKGNVTVLQETEEISLGKCQAYVNSL